MTFLIEWGLMFALGFITVLSHDLTLKAITQTLNKTKMIWIMLCLASIHVVHIWIYAAAYYGAVKWLKVATITSEALNVDGFQDFLYFSATNYTSLGYGDMIAGEGIRLLGTSQCLLGLLMIGWSTAFAFWWMQKHWLKVDNK